MKIIVAPDKFKGSLTSMEACIAIRKGIHGFDKKVDVSIFPMADGGDGFASVMKYYLGTWSLPVQSVDPLGRSISSSYEWNADERAAIVELASCSGLAMLSKEERNPLITSSYGTGLQIKHAIERGANKIILGLGGSSTNDAGMGILEALGFKFYNAAEHLLKPCGESLMHVEKIVPPASLPTVLFEIACDVNNPFHGPDGAACIFSPQKGAGPKQVQLLDAGLKHFAGVIQQHTGKDVSNIPGAGAAGGIAAGLLAYLDVNLVEGTRLVIQASHIVNAISGSDIIITGEGKLDHQSLKGKTIHAITSLLRESNIPVVALCGKVALEEPLWMELGLSLAVEINDPRVSEEESIKKGMVLLQEKTTSTMPKIYELAQAKLSQRGNAT